MSVEIRDITIQEFEQLPKQFFKDIDDARIFYVSQLLRNSKEEGGVISVGRRLGFRVGDAEYFFRIDYIKNVFTNRVVLWHQINHVASEENFQITHCEQLESWWKEKYITTPFGLQYSKDTKRAILGTDTFPSEGMERVQNLARKLMSIIPEVEAKAKEISET